MYCFPKKLQMAFVQVPETCRGRIVQNAKLFGLSGAAKEQKTGEIQAKCRLYSPSGAAFRMRRMRAFWSAYMW